MNAKRGIIVLGLLSAASMPTWAQQIKGVVIDQKSKETLIGAVVTVDGTNVKAITNIDGNFQIDGLDKEKKYTLYINCLLHISEPTRLRRISYAVFCLKKKKKKKTNK